MSSYGPGDPSHFGATPAPGGCRFSLFSKNATSVELLLFRHPEDEVPVRRIPFDSTVHKTGDVWHITVPDVDHGQLYGYLVDGPWQPETEGHRFNAHKLLLDPYAKAVVGGYQWNRNEAYSYDRYGPEGDLGFSQMTNWGTAPKAVVIDDDYDWERVRSPSRPLRDSVIYETHVRGFTRDSTSGSSAPGSYRAMQEKIPYLKGLGVTAVELLPVHEFNPHENIKTNPETGEPLTNFWGYSTVSFFSPAAWFASDGDGRTAVTEFKDLVTAHAKFLANNRQYKILIQGNTDDRGSREYNLALGQKRADAIKKMVTLLGAREEQVESVSLGKEQPKNEGQNEAAWAENRRGDILYQGEY